MTPNYVIYDVTITPVTPLHIGSGTTLLKDYDFAVAKNTTWRINEDAILAAQEVADDLKLAETLASTPPAQLLKPADFQEESAYFRYHLPGKPRAADAGAQLQEQLKTVSDEAFLPGSSTPACWGATLAPGMARWIPLTTT